MPGAGERASGMLFNIEFVFQDENSGDLLHNNVDVLNY